MYYLLLLHFQYRTLPRYFIYVKSPYFVLTLRLTLYLCIPPICWLSFPTAIFITFHDTCLLRHLFHRTVPETYNNEFTLTFYYKFSFSVLLWMEQGANELSLFKFRTRVSVHVNAHEDCNLF